MDVWCVGDYAAAGGGIADSGGGSRGGDAAASCDGNGPRGLKPINYLRVRQCGVSGECSGGTVVLSRALPSASRRPW